MELHVGTSGYSYKEWKGTFYPEDLSNKDMLSYYGERLGAVARRPLDLASELAVIEVSCLKAIDHGFSGSELVRVQFIFASAQSSMVVASESSVL